MGLLLIDAASKVGVLTSESSSSPALVSNTELRKLQEENEILQRRIIGEQSYKKTHHC